MKNRTYTRYFTKDKLRKINRDSISACEGFLGSKSENKDTGIVYRNYMNHFLVYISESSNNIYMCSSEFENNIVKILEGFVEFCREVLGNNQKVINNKIAVISSFFNWAFEQGKVKCSYMQSICSLKNNQDSTEESYVLTIEQIDYITKRLESSLGYDIQDKIIWHLTLKNQMKIGTLSELKLSEIDVGILDLETQILLDEWKRERQQVDIDSLFITWFNQLWNPMGRTTIQNRLKKIGNIIGIDNLNSTCIINSIRESE